MRTPKYLSNTSINLFYEDRMEFYLKYLADERPPRMPQTRPMSVGSAFDAYAKNYIVNAIMGAEAPPEYDLDTIFTTQVEAHNRDWARVAGEYVFECYKTSGALADLMIELELAAALPRFEFTVQKVINDIPLLGKPDIWFITKEGMNVLIDWKVNGYCAKRSVSPKKGYILIRDGWKDKKHSRSHGCAHKDAQIMKVGGLMVNLAVNLEDVDINWASQTTLYAWLMGEEIGGRFVVGIDQIVAKPTEGKPELRIARHRARVSKKFQEELWKRIKHVWHTIQYGHIFEDMTREESDARCLTLNDYHKAYDGDDPKEKWFQEITRGH